jgi:hypothetical protein
MMVETGEKKGPQGMAARSITLTLSPTEERALAELLSWTCERIKAEKVPNSISKQAEAIGTLNAALNAVR